MNLPLDPRHPTLHEGLNFLSSQGPWASGHQSLWKAQEEACCFLWVQGVEFTPAVFLV